MKKTIFVLVGIMMVSFAKSQCVGDEANVYSFTYNGTNYEIVKENLYWENAATCALTRGGFLTEINSQEEQDTIFYHVNNAGITASNTVAPDGGGASYLWIGGNDMAVEGDWLWDGDNTGTSTQFWQGTSSGSPVGGLYNNWGNEPDDFGTGQDGLGFAFTNWPLGVAGQWNDVDDANTLYYIIEYPAGSNSIDESEDTGLKVYPNPANDVVNIQLPGNASPNTSFKLYSLAGELIFQEDVLSSKNVISVSDLPDGVYFIHFYTKEMILQTEKIVVKK